MAAEKDRTYIIHLLLNAGANVNATDNSGRTALTMATLRGHTDIVTLLLDHQDIDVNVKDFFGYTPLIVAADKGDKDVVKMLLDKGADVNATDTAGRTALIVTALYGRTDVVRMLLAAGADVDARNNSGRTALMVAALYGRTDVVKMLLDKGADVNAKGKDGNTALMLAEEGGYTDIAYVIRTWGKGAYHGTGGIPGYFRSSTNIVRAEDVVPFPTYQDNVRRRADSLDDGELSGNERVLLMLDKLGNNQRGDEEFPDEVVDGIARHDDLIRATDHVRSFLGRRDQGQLASVARRFNDPPLFPYLEEDPPYADLDDVPYAYGLRDYRNHLAAEAAAAAGAAAAATAAAGAAAAAAAGIDPDVYNFMVSLDFLDFDPLNKLPTDEEVGDAIARQYLLEGDTLMRRLPFLPNAIRNVANRRVQEFGGLWGDAARAARASLEYGEDPEYIRNLVDAMIEIFPDDGESKEPVPDQESK